MSQVVSRLSMEMLKKRDTHKLILQWLSLYMLYRNIIMFFLFVFLNSETHEWRSMIYRLKLNMIFEKIVHFLIKPVKLVWIFFCFWALAVIWNDLSYIYNAPSGFVSIILWLKNISIEFREKFVCVDIFGFHCIQLTSELHPTLLQ